MSGIYRGMVGWLVNCTLRFYEEVAVAWYEVLRHLRPGTDDNHEKPEVSRSVGPHLNLAPP